MTNPITPFHAWLSQVFYCMVTSVPMGVELESYKDLDEEHWRQYYEMGLTPRDTVVVSYRKFLEGGYGA